MRHFRTIGTAWREPIAQETALPDEAPELPPSAKLALLYLRRNGCELSPKVIETMKAMGMRWSLADFDLLRSLNLVMRDPSMHHVLTPSGDFEARQIVRELARKYQLHHITILEGTRDRGPQATCSCGTFSVVRSKRNRPALMDATAKHLQSVKDGTWVPFTVQSIVGGILKALHHDKSNSGSAEQYCVSKFAAGLSDGAVGKCEKYPAAPIAIFADHRTTE